MSARLQVSGLCVDAAGMAAADDVGFELQAGTMTCLLGINGAGKSSVIRAVAGAARISSGCITLDGQDITQIPLERRAAIGIGWCPQGRRLFPQLTVQETLDIAAQGTGRTRDQRIKAILKRFPQLEGRLDTLAWQLSGGEQQMLAIARAVINEPRVVLLDEPSLGLAPAVVAEVHRVITSLAANGAAVLFAEPMVAAALAIADQALVMRRGALVLDVPASTLSSDHAATAMLDVPDAAS